MGVCGSITFEIDPSKPGHNDTALEVFDKIGLTKSEINKLYKSFCDMDQDESCYIQPVEIYSYLRMEPNDLNNRMFAAFDLDKSGRLNFLEYVCAMWNFLSMNPSHLGSFAFTIFDDDGSRTLDYKEVKQVIEMIHHKKYESNDGVRRIVDEIKDVSHEITLDQFAHICKEKPAMCAPLVSLQFVLRQKVVGTSFWNNLANRRFKSPEQSKVTYTMDLCQYVVKKYDKMKFQKMVQSKEKRRMASLQRIASAKATVEDETRHRTGLMLGYYQLTDAGAKEKGKLVDGKTRAKLEKRMSSIGKAKVAGETVNSADEYDKQYEEKYNDDYNDGNDTDRKGRGKPDSGCKPDVKKSRSTVVRGPGSEQNDPVKSRPSSATRRSLSATVSSVERSGSGSPLSKVKSRKKTAEDEDPIRTGDDSGSNLHKSNSRSSIAVVHENEADAGNDRAQRKKQRPSSALRRQTSLRGASSASPKEGIEGGSGKKPAKLEPLAAISTVDGGPGSSGGGKVKLKQKKKSRDGAGDGAGETRRRDRRRSRKDE